MSDLTPPLHPAPPAPPAPPPNRLSILHLMGWTLGSAMILAIWRLIESFQPQTQMREWFRVPLQMLSSMIYGAAVGSLILVVSRRLQRGPRFPKQPGHWLLVMLGVEAIGNCLMWVALIASGLEYIGLIQFVVQVFGFVLLALALVDNMQIRRWKIFFVIVLALSAMPLVFFVLRMINGPLSFVPRSLHLVLWPIPAVALLVVVGLDLRWRARRDFLHWTGVAAWFGSQALLVLVYLYFNFFPPQ